MRLKMNSDYTNEYLNKQFEFIQKEISRIMFHTEFSSKEKNIRIKELEHKLEIIEDKMS